MALSASIWMRVNRHILSARWWSRAKIPRKDWNRQWKRQNTWRKKAFSGYAVGMLHGRMKAAEKEQIMADFQSGKLQLLVSTTVIEVGVDVPNATVMLIQNAERFGLSQLHQLRGRVGRGAAESFCILVSGSDRFPPLTGDLQNQRWIPGSRRRFEAARSRRLFRSSAAWAASHQNRRTSRGYGIGGQNPGSGLASAENGPGSAFAGTCRATRTHFPNVGNCRRVGLLLKMVTCGAISVVKKKETLPIYMKCLDLMLSRQKSLSSGAKAVCSGLQTP